MKLTRLLLSCLLLALTLLACSFSVLSTPAPEDQPDPATDQPLQPPSQPQGENGHIARRHLAALTAIGPRWSGTSAEATAGQYIASVFNDLGYEEVIQSFSLEDEEGKILTSANIIAVQPGASSQVIVIGAHYDSSTEGAGTDDNASGVAVLLETAELLVNRTTPFTLCFVAFGAEEAGLFGSYVFVDSLTDSDLADIILYINLDSLSAGDITYAYAPESDATARDWALDWADQAGYDLETIWNVDLSNQEGYGTADYAAFDEAGIAWLYFEATNWQEGDQDGYTQVQPQYGDDGAIFHTPYDTLTYLDETFPGRVDAHLDLYVSLLNALLRAYPGDN